MANRDHSLDEKIIDAAIKEFMEKGFDRASLRVIAADAGVTVGAIYTRYKTKDSLFVSLVSPLIEKIKEAFCEIKKDFYFSEDMKRIDVIQKNMQAESDIILHLLFDDYERATLLLSKSRGSSLENFFDMIISKKIEETQLFFESAGIDKIKPNIMKMLIKAQFNMYFEIIDGGYSLQSAKEMMRAAVIYHTGGWINIFKS